MNTLWPAASRFSCRGPRALQECRVLEQLLHPTPLGLRSFSISPTPFRRKHQSLSYAPSGIRTNLPSFTRSTYGSFIITRTFASRTIIRTHDELPADYNAEEGLPFRSTPLSKKESIDVFGKGITESTANKVLRVWHGRRVAGTLDDPSISTSTTAQRLKPAALKWLRKHVPVDEEENAAQKAIQELQSTDDQNVSDLGKVIYKPNSGNATVQEPIPKTGYSVLDAMLQENKRLQDLMEARKAKEREAEEAEQRKSGPLAEQDLRSRVELRRPGENPWLKYYTDRAAKVVPDEPPEMSVLQRLWPSALVTMAVVMGCVTFATYYTAPATDARVWPDMPPAAATVVSIVIANTLIFFLWHVPPAFRLLTKYFLHVPGYPRALAVVGSTFSHQTLKHFSINMITLWFLGTRLHDDVGRGSFLSIYVSSGVISSFLSQTVFTVRNQLVSASLGASGAISGVIAAYLWLHGYEFFKVLGFPPDPMRGVTGLGILGIILVLEGWALRRSWTRGMKNDHYAHMAGYATGVAGAEILQRNAKERRRMLLEKRREERSKSEVLVNWR